MPRNAREHSSLIRTAANSEVTRTQLEDLMREAGKRVGTVCFAGGLPASETFPELQEAAAAALTDQSVKSSLQYAWPEGEPGLRSWVVERLARRGISVQADDVIITAGAQQALALASDALIEPGTRILVDRYCYPGALELFRARDACLTTERQRVDCVYAMPGVTNPMGDDTVERNLSALLALRCPIIADEAYAELRFDGRAPAPLRAMAPERVFLVGSVSKTLCPGLRLGWLVPPAGASATMLENKKLQDLQASTLSQALLSYWLHSHDYDRHLTRVNRLYRARAQHAYQCVGRVFPEWRVKMPQGGFCLFVHTDLKVCDVALLERACQHGVTYDPGSSFCTEPEKESTLTLRLCFSNLCSDQIDRGLMRLRRAVDELGPVSQARRRRA